MHRNSMLIFEKHLRPLFRLGQAVLELGPGSVLSPYALALQTDGGPAPRFFYADVNSRRIARQIADANAQLISMPDDVSLASESAFFDIVLSGQVVAFARRPWALFREIARVLKPGGLVLTITPLTWRHAPVGGFDGWRIFPDGMRALHDETGLETILAAVEALDPDGDRRHQMGQQQVADTVAVGRKPLTGTKAV